MDFPSSEPIEPHVVYEDEWLVAVRKPARMHSAPGLGAGDLCAWVFERFPDAKDLGPGSQGLGARQSAAKSGEGGLLHRLDYETSGLVLFARKAEALASLLDQQARGVFYKEYLAFASASDEALPRGSVPVKGVPWGVEPSLWAQAREALAGNRLSELLREAVAHGSCGVLSAFRSFGPQGALVACLQGEEAGKAYTSDILGCPSASIAQRGGNADAFVLRLGLARGFRHQIRAQLAWIGLPILGDPLYGGRSDERLRLYAVRLAFTHPESGLAISLESGD